MTTATPPRKPRTRPDDNELTVAQVTRHLNLSRQRVGQKLLAGAIPGARRIQPRHGHSLWVIPASYVRDWRNERIEAGFTVGPPVPKDTT